MTTSEDRIRELCSQALATRDDQATLAGILFELQTALAEHIQGIRTMAAQEVPRAFTPNVLESRTVQNLSRMRNKSTSQAGSTAQAGELATQAAARARQMFGAGIPGNEILAMLVSAAEKVAGASAVCSILVLDKDGLLRNGASPNLPPDYLAAIDRLKPDARVGTCAAAAATGSVVITRDFCADDKWAELRHLPLSLGFAGAWSMPIKSPDGRVLGTLGTYFRERRSPTREELGSIQVLASAASQVLASGRFYND